MIPAVEILGVEHVPFEEWVGYPLTACGTCGVPWPCDAVLDVASPETCSTCGRAVRLATLRSGSVWVHSSVQRDADGHGVTFAAPWWDDRASEWRPDRFSRAALDYRERLAARTTRRLGHVTTTPVPKED